MRVLSAIACAVLMSSPALAQDGLRSASLPERPRHRSLSPQGIDHFRARPDTYQVRPTPLPIGGGAFLPTFFPTVLPPAAPVVIVVERVVEAAPRAERAAPAPAPAQPAPAPPMAAPGPPKTFYVIPGCYAGNRRPEPEQLPAGCDLRRLRVVPPRE